MKKWVIVVETITKASTDPNDLEALTQNLLLKTMPSLPPGQFLKEDICSLQVEASSVYVGLILEKMD